MDVLVRVLIALGSLVSRVTRTKEEEKRRFEEFEREMEEAAVKAKTATQTASRSFE